MGSDLVGWCSGFVCNGCVVIGMVRRCWCCYCVVWVMGCVYWLVLVLVWVSVVS